jgi:2-phospho-L-lactate guanylyltransferase
MARALVPLKDLVTAKTRLSGLLRPAERRALAQAMVEDVLTTLVEHKQIERVTLVSDDPGAGLLAGKYDIECLDESKLGCRGLNPILEKSCDKLLGCGDEPLIVLHGDIPLLSSRDIDAVVLTQDQTDGLVIGCDRHSLGTNLLAFGVGSRPQFSFGVDSCASHSRNASTMEIPFSILHRDGIGLDIDEPDDIALLLHQFNDDSRGHTASILWQTALGKRLETLLLSMDKNRLNPVLDRKIYD